MNLTHFEYSCMSEFPRLPNSFLAPIDDDDDANDVGGAQELMSREEKTKPSIKNSD